MSEPNAGGKNKSRKRDSILRWLGLRPRSSPPSASNTVTGDCTIAPTPGAARSPRPNGNNSERRSQELIPDIAIAGPLGNPGLVPPRHRVPHNLAQSKSSPGLDTTPAPQVGAVFDKSEAGGLWTRALSRLSEKDKNTLENTASRSNLDIEELLGAVRVKRELCLRNQWEFEFQGRAVNLRYQADKIISWLSKFKEVGDIAIQHDPGHAALPWAGIRFLLQVGPVTHFCIGC